MLERALVSKFGGREGGDRLPACHSFLLRSLLVVLVLNLGPLLIEPTIEACDGCPFGGQLNVWSSTPRWTPKPTIDRHVKGDT